MNIFREFDIKHQIMDILILILGSLLMAIAFNLFIMPNNIVYGGISGLSIITKELFNIDPALFIFVVSLLLLICSTIFLDTKKTIHIVLGTFIFPFLIKWTENIGNYIVIEEADMLLMAIFGGLIDGVGIGLILKTGSTTGGTDIINQILHEYLKISLGTAMLIVDGIIVLSSGFVFGPEIIMYGIITLYIASIVTDKVVLGISDSKAFYIITTKQQEVQSFIINNLSRGVTLIEASGGYSGKDEQVLLCVIPTREYFKLKEGIAEIDDDAFFVITDAYEASQKS